jgi:Ca2+-transporting ATPase
MHDNNTSNRKRNTGYYQRAVEVLLDKIDEHQKPLVSAFERKANEVANEGYRVIGYAIKEMRALLDPKCREEIESSLTFIGFAGMIDPPRNEAKGSFSMHTESSL